MGVFPSSKIIALFGSMSFLRLAVLGFLDCEHSLGCPQLHIHLTLTGCEPTGLQAHLHDLQGRCWKHVPCGTLTSYTFHAAE